MDFYEARDSEWQWHQQVCTALQTDNHSSTPPVVFTGRMPFLPPNHQRQSIEGRNTETLKAEKRQKDTIQTKLIYIDKTKSCLKYVQH